MTVAEKKQKFIDAWGCLSCKWGINKTMAHIHALLLFEEQALCADEIMKLLEVSRGNVNMNLRCLVDWELIEGVSKKGDRKEYFIAEKDMWIIFSKIIKKRKEKELIPLQNLLNDLCTSEKGDSKEEEEFHNTICEMRMFADKADKMLENVVNSDNSWIMKGFKMMIR